MFENAFCETDSGNISAGLELLMHKNLPLEDFAIERGIDQRVHFIRKKTVEVSVDKFRGLIDNPDGCFNTPLEFQP